MATNSASMSTSGWMKFFCNAGIPADVAGNYAVIFNGHRMQMDMLSDLSMEILKVMGINVMGDIIAILKHAKEIHTKVTRERALNIQSTPPPAPPPAPAPVKKAVRHLPASRLASLTTVRKVAPKTVSSSGTVVSLKRSVMASSQEPAALPMAKVRRVLPEEEGGYTIKMPTGTTAKTKRILEHGAIPKRSVFQRLGDSKVTSTTDNGDGTKITLTSFGRSVMDSAFASNRNASVFDRLGPGSVSSTSGSEDTAQDIVNKSLQYHGIFKNVNQEISPPPPPPKKVIVRTAKATSSGLRLVQDEIGQKMSILNRLGPKIRTSPMVNAITRELKSASLVATKLKTPMLSSSSSSPQTAGILGGVKRKTADIHSRLGKKTQIILKDGRRATLQPRLRIVQTLNDDGSEAATKIVREASSRAIVTRKVKKPLLARLKYTVE